MISIEIRGDYTSFRQDMAKVRELAAKDGKAIADAMNNVMSPSAANSQMLKMAREINTAARAAQGVKTNIDTAMESVRRIGDVAGVSGRQFERMAQQSMKVATARQLENSMRNVQKITGASAWEMAKLRSSIGDNVGAVKAMGQAASESFRRIANLRNAVIAGATAYGLSESAKTAMQFDTYQRSFNAIAGSQEGGADQMRFVREEAERLGQGIFALADSYRGLSAAAMTSGLTQEQVRDVFSSVGEASTTLGLTSDQTKYALYALQQMMSKGVVSMEELRRQLGDSLPGAFAAAARAMGVTEAELIKLVESGELMSRDFLPKFADELRKTFGAGFKEAAQSAARQITRLSNTWTEAKNSFGSGFLDEAADGAVRLADFLNRNNENIKMAGELVGDVANFLGSATIKTIEFVQLSTVGWIGITESVLAFCKAAQRATTLFDGISPIEAFSGFSDELKTIWSNAVALGDEITGNLNPSLDAAGAGMNTAANAADNTADAAWNAADAYKDLAAAMSLVGNMGVSIGKSMASDMKILTDFTKEARSAAVAARDQAKANADLAWMSLDSQRQKFIDSGDFEAAMELNIALKQQAEYLREIERGEIGIEKARRSGRGRKGGLSEAEKEARAAKKAHREMVNNLQEQLHFYDQLRNVMPAAGAEYAAIRQQIMAVEEEQYRAIGISQEYLDVWRDYSSLREATDALSGLKVAMIDYLSEMTAAKQAHDLFNTSAQAFSGMLLDTVTGAKSAKEAFSDMASTIVNKLVEIMIQMYVMKPIVTGLMGMLSGSGSGGGGFLGSLFSGLLGLASAKGNVFPAGPGISAYSGRIVSRPTLFPFAKGVGLMGEAGAEAIMPLKRDSSGRLGVSAAIAGGGGAAAPIINVQVVNQTSVAVAPEVTSTTNPQNGNTTMKVLLKQIDQSMEESRRKGQSQFGRGIEADGNLASSRARRSYFGV